MAEDSQAIIERFKNLIYNESGIYFYDVNQVVLEARLNDLIKENHCTPEAYYQKVLGEKEALKELLDRVSTHLTRFFRNEGHFNVLRKELIPKIFAKKEKARERVFNFWSAGCSTGEECYSVAMVLADMLPGDYKIRVVGSDLSLSSLKKANEGFFPAEKTKGIPSNYLNRFFCKEEGGYRVSDYLKSLVRFDYHNLNFPSAYVGNDLVFCRNVLIYFDAQTQERVVNHIWETMRSGAYLFIGHSESLLGMNTPFRFISTKEGCFYQKE